jgi:hypothetical protein
MSTIAKVPEPKLVEIRNGSTRKHPLLNFIPSILQQLAQLHVSSTVLYATLSDISLGPTKAKGNVSVALNRFKFYDAKNLDVKQAVTLLPDRSYHVTANVSVSLSNITTDQHVSVLLNLLRNNSAINSSHVEFVSSGNRTQNLSLSFIVTAKSKETLSLGLMFEADGATSYTYEVLSGSFSVTAL